MALLGHRGRVDRPGDVLGDRIVLVAPSAWSRGRIALLGDAASYLSPRSGRGTEAAVTGGGLLAEQLHTAPDVPSALPAYERLLRPGVADQQRRTLRRTDRVPRPTTAPLGSRREGSGCPWMVERLTARDVTRRLGSA